MAPLYVYAIVADPITVADLVGLGGGPLRLVSHGACHAVAENVVTSPPLSADTLRAQDTLVRRLAARAAALLPARFGSRFPDEATLHQTIKELAPRLESALARVRGCEQMTIRLFGQPQASVEPPPPNPSGLNPSGLNPSASNPPGLNPSGLNPLAPNRSAPNTARPTEARPLGAGPRGAEPPAARTTAAATTAAGSTAAGPTSAGRTPAGVTATGPTAAERTAAGPTAAGSGRTTPEKPRTESVFRELARGAEANRGPEAIGPGTAYLRQRVAEARHFPAVVDTLRARVAGLISAERIERGQPPLIASIHHLIPRGTAEAYHAAVQDVAASPPLTGEGLRLRVSGPSPAYAFTEADLR